MRIRTLAMVLAAAAMVAAAIACGGRVVGEAGKEEAPAADAEAPTPMFGPTAGPRPAGPNEPCSYPPCCPDGARCE